MADNKHWFKVWTSILTDPSLSYLHNQSIGAWVRLCALTAQHGTNGILKINSQQLLVTLHLSNATQREIEKVFSELQMLNITVSQNIQKESVTLVTLQFLNWGKYQAYSESYERVNKFRQKKSVTVKKRYTCNVEEKRREKKREEEKRKEENKKSNTTTTRQPEQLPVKDLIAFFCEEFKARYGENPYIGKKEAGVALRLTKIENIKEIITKFIKSDDKFITNNKHGLNIIESQLHKLSINQEEVLPEWLQT